MKFENTQVWGFEHAIRGMRNPLNSWARSDSKYDENGNYILGPNDMDLAKRLTKGGTEHRKYLRQIFISVDITAPIYWWKEFDTYKVGTTSNSTSTMHKLATTPITPDCFETDDYCKELDVGGKSIETIVNENIIDVMEKLRVAYLETKDKKYWKELIRWLPEGWLQTRTISMNYENAVNMYFQRKDHKLSEWSSAFTSWVTSLPYFEELILK